MGEAEDIVAARRAAENTSERTKYLSIAAEIKPLVPLAAANLKKHGYPQNSDMREVNFQGQKRVSWNLYYDGWYCGRDINLLADGILVEIPNDHPYAAYLYDPLAKDRVEKADVEIVERVVSSLRNLATSDFQIPKVRGISPF